MDPKEPKAVEDEGFVIDRKPVALAYCAHPTPKSPEKEEIPKKDPLTEIFELSQSQTPIEVSNPARHRRAVSLKSFGCDTESEFELSDEDSDFEETYAELQSGKHDSDEEFDKITSISARIIQKTHKAEYPDGNEPKKQKRTPKAPKTDNVHEYDNLPPIELLSIQCNANLIEFGVVSKVVDCMVVIESTSTDVLDFDSYLFDEKGNSIGQIYDIFGQVKAPQYAIRYNSTEEAQLIPINMKVFYAPNESEYSKTPFKGLNLAAANREHIRKLNSQLDQQEAINQAISLSGASTDAYKIGSDVEFSDDEAEKEYRQKKKNAAGQLHPSNPSTNARKRRNNGRQKVRFNDSETTGRAQFWQPPNQPNPAPPKPYRRELDVTPSESASESKNSAPTTTPPTNSTISDNPYAEFGVHSTFNGRFGI